MKAAVSSLLAGCASFYDSMHLEPCISSPQNAYDHLTSDCNLDQTLSGLNRIHDESHFVATVSHARQSSACTDYQTCTPSA